MERQISDIVKVDGYGGRVFTWTKDFMVGRAIKVKIANELSDQYVLENGPHKVV